MLQLALIHKRIIAYIIDAVLLITIAVLFSFLSDFISIEYDYFFKFCLILFLLGDTFHGQSIGKRLLKIQIVNFKTQKPTGFIISVVRNLICLLNFTLIFAAINYILFVYYYRNLSDFLTGTCVIENQPSISKDKQ